MGELQAKVESVGSEKKELLQENRDLKKRLAQAENSNDNLKQSMGLLQIELERKEAELEGERQRNRK